MNQTKITMEQSRKNQLRLERELTDVQEVLRFLCDRYDPSHVLVTQVFDALASSELTLLEKLAAVDPAWREHVNRLS